MDLNEYCCWRCFEDNYLASLIRDRGVIRPCVLCGARRRKAMDTDTLRELFEPVVGLYANIEDFMPLEHMKELAGSHQTLAEKIVDDWETFADAEKAAAFLNTCTDRQSPDYDPFDPERLVAEEDRFFLGEYYSVQQLTELWTELKTELATQNRFFAGRGALKELRRHIANAVTSFKASVVLYRARPSEAHQPHPKKKMGAPPAASATAGRANPAGIAYLYLASTPETAVSEMRPHVGDHLTVGTFRLRRQLQVVDLRGPFIDSPFRWGDKLPAVLRVMEFLRKLGGELSRPISAQRKERDYLPTQYLCELMKTKGYDGVAYKSGLCEGYNVALFDPDAARCVAVEQVHVKSVQIAIGRGRASGV